MSDKKILVGIVIILQASLLFSNTRLLTKSFKHPRLQEWYSKAEFLLNDPIGLSGENHLGLIKDNNSAFIALQNAVDSLANAHGFLVFEYSSYRIINQNDQIFQSVLKSNITQNYSYSGPFIVFSPCYSEIEHIFKITFWVNWDGFQNIDSFSIDEKKFITEQTQQNINLNFSATNSVDFLFAETKGTEHFKTLLDGELVEWRLEAIRFEGNGYFFTFDNIMDFNTAKPLNQEEFQWLKNDKSLPLAFALNETVKIHPVFVGINIKNSPIIVKAKISYRSYPALTEINLNEISGELVEMGNGTYELISESEFETQLMNHIGLLDPLIIDWEIQVGGDQGSVYSVETSIHKVYITLYNTVIYSIEEALFFGCTQAQYLNQEDQVIDKLWAPFITLSVNQRLFGPDKPNRILTYYEQPDPICRSITIMDGQGSIDGECTAFANTLKARVCNLPRIQPGVFCVF